MEALVKDQNKCHYEVNHLPHQEDGDLASLVQPTVDDISIPRRRNH